MVIYLDAIIWTILVCFCNVRNISSTNRLNAELFGFSSQPPLFPFPPFTEMTGEVHICSLQEVVGVQIEAMIYDMCCKQSLCISQGPVTAPAPAVKGSVILSLILHLGHYSLVNMRSECSAFQIYISQ